MIIRLPCNLEASNIFRIIIHPFKLEMQPKIALFALLAFAFIASTSYARPTPEQYGHVVKGEAMLKQQNLTDIRNSGSNRKMKSDTKDEVNVNKWDPVRRLTIESDDPIFKDEKTVDEFGPDFPIYDGPLFMENKTAVGKPKP